MMYTLTSQSSLHPASVTTGEGRLGSIHLCLFCHRFACDIIGLTLTEKQWQADFFKAYYVLAGSSGLTPDPVFRDRGPNAQEDFTDHSLDFLSSWLESPVSWQTIPSKERGKSGGEEKKCRPGRKIIIFPLISSMWWG